MSGIRSILIGPDKKHSSNENRMKNYSTIDKCKIDFRICKKTGLNPTLHWIVFSDHDYPENSDSVSDQNSD